MLRIGLLIFCNIIVIISTIEYVRKLKIKNKNDKIISGIIIYFFRIILYELILGYIIKYLNYYSITLTFILEFIVLYCISLIKKDSLLKYIINLIKIYKNKKIEIKLNFNFIITIFFIIIFVIISFISLSIYEYSYDGNYYHLSHIIDYIQQGKIYQTNNSIWNNVYPQNIELLNMFYMIFTHSIKLVRIPQIIFCLLGMIGVYSLLKEFSFSSKVSYRCAILYFLTPFVLTQITTTYIDAVGCSTFIVLLYFLVKILKTNKFNYEILYFMLLSIFMGIKGTYVIYACIMCCIYLIYKIYILFKKKEKFRIFCIKELSFLCIVLFIGCSWIIQNIILFKNPIHPFKFLWIDGMEANIDIGEENEPYCLKGKNYIEKIAISWLGLNSSYLQFDNGKQIDNLYKDYDSRIGGLGIQWIFFLIPCIILSIDICLAERYKMSKEQIIVILTLIICFILTPANWWGRYVGYIVFTGYIGYGIVDKVFSQKKYYNYINNTALLIIIVLSILFSTRNIFRTLLYTTPYNSYNYEFANYIETGNKNIIVLEESYYESTKSYVFLKGTCLQNIVNTYYIEDMYPNPKVPNHGIKTYENFEKIINDNNELDAIIILDANINRKNYDFAERLYNENIDNYIKKNYGVDIIVYEKVK